MKLLRHGEHGEELPGVLDSAGRLRDLSPIVADITGALLQPEALAKLRETDIEALPPVAGTPRLGPPLAGVGKIVGVGLNYRKHAAEAGLAVPAEPVLFGKAGSAIAGPDDALALPREAQCADWEVELAVVIGRQARRVSEARALEFVAGYCTANDVSERAWQFERGGQWIKGKSLDGFAPLGPWLVTADEVPDPQALELWLELNGERRQHASTADMVFGVAELVSYISHFMTLAPGDVILTGTPAGVGFGCKPPRYLRPGDRLRLAVEGLGVQTQEVVALD